MAKIRIPLNVNDITLHAVWKEENPATYMQNWQGCSALTQGSETVELTDKRDGNTYTVAKLKDYKCWMVDNLKIAGKTITSDDSNVTSSYIIPASSDPSTFKTDCSNTTHEAVNIDPTYGGYYTWQVATAGSGSSHTTQGDQAPDSICPKGWHLPTGGAGGEFEALNNFYGNITNSDSHLIASPVPGFVRAGYLDYSSGSLHGLGSDGHYWSSTAYRSTEAYGLYHYISNVNPANYNVCRVHGFSVRCVAD